MMLCYEPVQAARRAETRSVVIAEREEPVTHVGSKSVLLLALTDYGTGFEMARQVLERPFTINYGKSTLLDASHVIHEALSVASVSKSMNFALREKSPLEYSEKFKTAGCLLAGTAAQGPVWDLACALIGDVLGQALGPTIPAARLSSAYGSIPKPSDMHMYINVIHHGPHPLRARAARPAELPTRAAADCLAAEVRALDWASRVEPEAQEAAQRAINEAAAFLEDQLPGTHATVALSDDGVVTVKWQRDGRGALLIFSGDGTGTFSVSDNGSLYGMNYQDFDLRHGLPETARRAITELADL